MALTKKDWQLIGAMRDEVAKVCIGKELKQSQKRLSNKILISLFENRGLTLASEWSRQSGKTSGVTATCAFLLVFFFEIVGKYKIDATPQFNIGFFGPLQQQADAPYIMLKEYLKKLEKEGYAFQFDSFNGDTITVKSPNAPTRQVYCMTASPTSHQESKTLNLIILDESQDLIDKVVQKAILPMGASTNATVVWIGVGGYRRCNFYDHIEKLPESQKVILSVNKVLQEHKQMFELTGDQIYLNYEKYIQKTINEIGSESDEFKTQYELHWVLERGQFITYENLMRLEQDYAVLFGNVHPFYAGIDWGKASDSTVMTIVNEHAQIIEWYEWQGDDYASQIEEIVSIVKMYPGLKTINCDSTGNQDMAVDILRQKTRSFNVNVNPI